MTGNFKFTYFGSTPKAYSGQSIEACWGTIKNIGDADYAAVALVDKSTNKVIASGNSPYKLPTGHISQVKADIKMPNTNFSGILYVGWYDPQTKLLHVTDYRAFVIENTTASGGTAPSTGGFFSGNKIYYLAGALAVGAIVLSLIKRK